MQITSAQPRRALEFGIYRDGDNNLDTSQQNVLTQAQKVSLADRSIQFTVENTNALATENYTLDGGVRGPSTTLRSAQDDTVAANMADPDNLAQFVARTLDNAQASGAKQTWIDLVDHGAGDGGGLEADSFHGIMPMQSIADAIAKGEALHAREHPEDANRNVDGVVANQCLMSTLGFADALSHAGVKYLAASPETMLSPGVPSTVAEAIARNAQNPKALAHAVVADVMDTRYRAPGSPPFGPAAAFDVLDLAPEKIAKMESAVRTFNNDAAAQASHDTSTRTALRKDINGVDGMVRFPEATPDMPWHADRPALAVYDAIARDAHVSKTVRNDAAAAADAVGALVLAHSESSAFAPFGDASYADAVGPTIHDPLAKNQIDPWAPAVSETKNRFYVDTNQDSFIGAIA